MTQTLAVATRKGLFLFDEQGNIERTAFLGDPVTAVHRNPHSGISYAALDHGHFGVKMHRSHNDGADWEECACPIYPEKPMDAPEDDKNPWTLNMIWCLASGHSDSASHIWCGTIPGGLFRSTDNGDSWQLIGSLWNRPERKQWFGGGKDQPGIHSICVDPRNDHQILLGISCGGIWLTEDGGVNWQQRGQGLRADFLPPEQAYDQTSQDPHCVVQCRHEPDKLWCQHHNGIFKSTDCGQNWQELNGVKPSHFGFAVAVNPHNGDHAWFVPAIKDQWRIPVDGKVIINETVDGGKTFTARRDGLPQQHAYDLCYRHALAVDDSGQTLAFGSTTGSLWRSSDQGQTWKHLSAHLPPVYAVEFISSFK